MGYAHIIEEPPWGLNTHFLWYEILLLEMNNRLRKTISCPGCIIFICKKTFATSVYN